MHTDSRTPDQIEREIERERAGLADAVDALQDKFSLDAVIRELSGGFRRHGGDFGTAVTRSAKQNPVALAVTGIGLAWLMFGRSYDEPDHDPRAGDSRVAGEWDDAARFGPAYRSSLGDEPVDRRGVPGSHARTVGRPGTGSRDPAYPDWARHDLDEHEDGGEHRDAGPSFGARAAEAARNGAGSVGSGARDAADAASSGARSAAQALGSGASAAAEGVGRAAQGAADSASRARDRLARGTEDLSEGARERILTARARAVDMAGRAEDAARRNYARGRDATADFIEEQPLVAGAVAMAVGAALAGALPRTRREDDAFGEARDDLFDEAERIFRDERRKAENVAKAAVDEAGQIAKEKSDTADRSAPGEKSAVEAVADEARNAGKRVRDAAEKQAKKENLGNPRS